MSKKKKKLFADEFVWLLMAGLWMAGIFVVSSIDGSGEHYFDLKILIERKGAHVFEFFVLAYLFFNVLRHWKISFKSSLLFMVALSMLYAVSDEFHQLFVFGREGKITDVGIDGIGVLLFLGFLLTWRAWFKIELQKSK
jgi:hypothetical protein